MSIRIKLVLICAAVVLIVMVISGSFMLLNIRNAEIDRAREQLIRRARYINEEIIQNFYPGEWVEEFDISAGQAPRGPHDIQYAVLSALGIPIAPLEMGRLEFTDEAVIAAIAGSPGFSASVTAPDFTGVEQEWLVYALPVEREGISYIVYTRMSARPMNENLAELATGIVVMVLMALVSTVVLWFLFADTLTKPIIMLTRHSKEMALGNFDFEQLGKKMPVYSADEIGQLTESFNYMAEELNSMMDAHAQLDGMRREFVANVSHELRTPLASIMSYAETLLDGALDDPETAKNFLQVIGAESRRMTHLVTDLLELSRLDNNPNDMEMEVVDLVGLAKMAVKHSLVAAEEKQQSIIFVPPSSPCFIEAVPTRINQVFVNILTNSIKYSPEQTNIEVSLEESSKYYRILIKDNGIGVSKEDLPHVFERFYRVDKARSRAQGGTGLGLAIAKEIMESHGGKITVSSELGKGTLMLLRFNKYSD